MDSWTSPLPGRARATALDGPAEPSAWEDLIRRMATGDEGALAALYDATSGMLFALALRVAGDRRDAEEALLDTYAKAWRSAPGFDAARGSARTWLVMMTRSAAIDRRRAARAAEPLGEVADETASLAAGPEERLDQDESGARARRALGRLPPEQRQAVELAFFGGLTHSALAARLGLPLGTVKTRIRLGMQRLRTLIEDQVME